VIRVQFEDLNDVLMSNRTPEDSFLLSDLDGFLHGLAAGPEFIMPSEWLQHVWGHGEPEFADEAEAKRVLGTIVERYQEIDREFDRGLDADPDPIFWHSSTGDAIVMDWADGFMEAVGLRRRRWQRLFNDPQGLEMIAPIAAHCVDGNGTPPYGLHIPKWRQYRENAPDRICDAVVAIADFWRYGAGRHQPSNQNVRTAATGRRKVGRNEPCPCGSGKKYKRCCGAR
jgi:uncharacterized protein